MTLNEIKIISEISTPFLVFIFGIILLRKTEQIKSSVNRSSDFSVKWANEFFEVYRHFLNETEETMNLLFHLQQADEKEGDKIVEKLRNVLVLLTKSELHMSIMLSSFPKIESNLNKHSHDIIVSLSEMIKTKKGNFDDLKLIVANFSNSARNVHGELLKHDY